MVQVGKTLYIVNDGFYIHCENDALVIRSGNDDLMRVPALNIQQIVIFGNTTVSSYLIGYCCKNKIFASYVSQCGRYYGSFFGEQNGNVLLRQKQYSLRNTKQAVDIARNIILGKAINQRYTLLNSAKNASKENAIILKEKAGKIMELIKKTQNVESMESLRGTEGSIADIYFDCFDNILKTDDPKMMFKKRSRRPPENNCNAALSLLYTLETLNCVSALEIAGLDSELGYLHELRSGRHSLACDLVEEFRSCVVDQFVINMINTKQISSKDFEEKESGIQFKKESLNKFLKKWEDYKSTEIMHPIYKKKTEMKILPYIQAQLLAQVIRGDIPEYPPIEWR